MKAIKVAKDSDTLKSFLRRVLELMQQYDGSRNEVNVANEETGEIMIWKHKDEFCNNYAIIPIMFEGQLTPSNKSVKEKLTKGMHLDKSMQLTFNKCTYVMLPYGSELRNTIVTVGYLVKKIDSAQQL